MNIVPRKYDEYGTHHIIYTIPWLKHSPWFDAETTLHKAFNQITQERTEREESSHKKCLSYAIVHIVEIRVVREVAYKYMSEKIEHQTCEHTCDDGYDEASNSFIFSKPFCVNGPGE